MRAFDVLVIPLPWNPYFAFYMSPMKLFEYMASGRCIVATNVESLCEILENDKNSLLAKHSNTADLAEKILASMDSPELREKLAAQAFKDVAFHTWLRRAERIIQFIKLPPDQRNSA
jgi:glycosyltransferase involved in cell wall biosynthesis